MGTGASGPKARRDRRVVYQWSFKRTIDINGQRLTLDPGTQPRPREITNRLPGGH